jgi:hypothetical protein
VTRREVMMVSNFSVRSVARASLVLVLAGCGDQAGDLADAAVAQESSAGSATRAGSSGSARAGSAGQSSGEVDARDEHGGAAGAPSGGDGSTPESADATTATRRDAGFDGARDGRADATSAESGVNRTTTGDAAPDGSANLGPACPRPACTTCGANGNKHNLNNDSWAGSLTLFISYSSDTRTQTVDKGFTAAQWNAAVNSFDVPAFAAQVQATGAKNILLMLGQNTGYYCSPNAAYEKYAGVAPGTRASIRDLPMEIADALAPNGIGVYLYLPEDVGWGDRQAASSFGLTSLALANWVVDASFTPKWNAVVKTWADRYGTKVKGWFFDGYDSRWGVTSAMAQTYRDTCLAANPCGIVTFNGANGNGLSDTERGETRINATTGLPAKGLPTSRWTSSDLQTMWAFPLQAAWGQEIADDSPAIYSNANLAKFIAAGVKAQTVFALDVRTSLAGRLSTPVYQQLLAVRP